ncbi:MAG: hypothetical protein JOZ49_03840 [Mycolicibacterium sp.]|nr:hypothetical protein [Mycolicibacterium sp.]
MSVSVEHDQIAVALAANMRQAEYYRSELARQSDLLDHRVAKHQNALSAYERCGEITQARRIRRELRHCENERRTLQHLLAALDERFPHAGHLESRG